MKNPFSADSVRQTRGDRPVVLLSVVFTVFCFYSIFGLYMLAAGADAEKQQESAGQAVRDNGKERLLLLKNKAEVLDEHRAKAVLPRSPDSVAVPFGFVPAGDGSGSSLAETFPQVKVRALGERGAARVALIDIDGEECRLVCEQEEFGAAGRVLRIDDKGITWAWGSREFRSLIWE